MIEQLRALEPAALAEAVRMVLGALVMVGWVAMDDAAINAVVTAVAAVASVVLTVVVRKKVTPVSKLESPGH